MIADPLSPPAPLHEDGALAAYSMVITVPAPPAPIVGLDPPIALVGRLTRRDVWEAFRLERSTRKRGLVILSLAYIVAFIAILVALGLSMRPYAPTSAYRVLGTAALFGCLAVGRWLWNWFLVRRLWRQQAGIFTPVETTLSASGMERSGANFIERISWNYFHSYRRGPRTLLLYHAQGGWLLMARSRFADDASWERMLAFVQAAYPAA